MKHFNKIIAFLLVFALPSLVWADIVNILNPSALATGSDNSINYLQDIFGVVGGVLHGSGTQIMGHMFGIFNSGCLFLGSIILGYTTIVGTLNTANEGEFLGKKWSSIWIPVRSAIGLVLLVPQSTGYSLIQVLMMWVIVQGVGLADSVWNSALGYLSSGGVLIQQPLALDMTNVGSKMGDIFRSETCMYVLQNALRQSYNAAQQNDNPIVNGVLAPPALLTTVVPIQKGSTEIDFPGIDPNNNNSIYNSLKGVCGSITFAQTTAAAKYTALEQVILDMAGYAQAFANVLFPTETNIPLNPIPINIASYSSFSQLQQNNSDLNNFVNYLISYFPFTLFSNSTSDYQGILLPVVNESAGQQNQNLTPTLVSQMEANGWINAGAYYWTLASVNATAWSNSQAIIKFDTSKSSLTQIQKDLANLNTVIPPYAVGTTKTIQGIFSGQFNLVEGAIAVMNAVQTFQATASPSDTLTLGPLTFSGTYGGRVKPVSPPGNENALGNASFVPIAGLGTAIAQVVDAFNDLQQAQANNQNPLLSLAIMGSGLINTALQLWGIAALAAIAITTALSAVPCVSLGVIGITLSSFIVPVLSAVCLSLFMLGFVQQFYIPLIPMIVFVFSSIGWIIVVFEAIAAAPLVALGITHPEGHEVVGRADQGLLLLVSVFLTPTLMIIGFIGGIILSFVGIWILNAGFFQTLSLAPHPTGFAMAFSTIAELFIYTALVVSVTNQSFALIHIIPDKVMRWIGAPSGVGIGEASKEALGQAKEATQGLGRDIGGGVKAGSDQAPSNFASYKAEREKQESKDAAKQQDGGANILPQGGGGGGAGAGAGGAPPVA